jgi:RNA polymerase-binding transcription factor DksA
VKKEKEANDASSGRSSVPSAVRREWADQYRHLLALRERLLEDRQGLISDTRFPVGTDGAHLADLGTDEFERDLDLCLLSAGQNALFELEEAIHRIEHGTYGICEASGRPIPKARLRAIPWTRFTAEAELELEREGSSTRPHLGELGHIEAKPEALSVEIEKLAPAEGRVPDVNLERLADNVAAKVTEQVEAEADVAENEKPE